MPSKEALDNLDQFVEAVRTEAAQPLRLELTVDLEVLDALVASAKGARFLSRPASKLEKFAVLVVNALGAGAKTLEVNNLSLKEKPNGNNCRQRRLSRRNRRARDCLPPGSLRGSTAGRC